MVRVLMVTGETHGGIGEEWWFMVLADGTKQKGREKQWPANARMVVAGGLSKQGPTERELRQWFLVRW
jgi:hypothetical protein